MEEKKMIVALGVFDGVHRGHAALLAACQQLARAHHGQTGVVTFSSHPDGLVCGQTPALINTAADRERLLRQRFGMDRVLTLPFDRQMQSVPWQEFLIGLEERYHVAGFVCGADFRFGNQGIGNAELLRQYCESRNYPWAVVPQVSMDGQVISSTRIRQLLTAGEMEQAVRLLGHPHILTGQVVPGQQLGRTIGIPTANLHLPEQLAVPRFGVYACRVWIRDRAYLAVTNIGTRPTVRGEGVTVEPWILDFSGDLYGQEITVEFHRFLRPERKFPSLEALREEIEKNAEETRKIFEKT